ncbi:MAG: hypothetical protein KA792_02725 [Bacteroidales bacterium]|nr:hypothetical protein [Bacteroidales bacterium]
MRSIVQNVVKSILMIVFTFTITSITLKAQDGQKLNYLNAVEISTGFSYLIYQSGYGFKSSQGVEVLVSKRLYNNYKAESGFRTTLGAFLPEVFVRGIVINNFERWQPVIGFETGITKRADFESSTNLLKESREAMLKDVGYLYLSTHIEVLSFNLKRKLNISFLEFDIGTHYKYFGRTIRAQTTLLRLRKIF